MSEFAHARRFPRYDVSRHPSLIGHILEQHAPDQLVAIGQGGCGFYGENLDGQPKLYEGKPVTVSFSMPNAVQRPLQVSGSIAYSYRQKVDGRDVIFCGIEFDDDGQSQIRPIITQLEIETVLSQSL